MAHRASKHGKGKMLESIEDQSRRYTSNNDKVEFEGAYKEGTEVLALLGDKKTYQVAEILKVRQSLFFKEQEEDENETCILQDDVPVPQRKNKS